MNLMSLSHAQTKHKLSVKYNRRDESGNLSTTSNYSPFFDQLILLSSQLFRVFEFQFFGCVGEWEDGGRGGEGVGIGTYFSKNLDTASLFIYSFVITFLLTY